MTTPTENFHFELPNTAEPTHFLKSSGFVHEIQAVREAILKGN